LLNALKCFVDGVNLVWSRDSPCDQNDDS